MMEWLGFMFCMGVSGLLVFVGLFMGLWSMAAHAKMDGDAFAALLMLVLGGLLGHWAWVNAPFAIVMK
jgi:hypothetical protein